MKLRYLLKILTLFAIAVFITGCGAVQERIVPVKTTTYVLKKVPDELLKKIYTKKPPSKEIFIKAKTDRDRLEIMSTYINTLLGNLRNYKARLNSIKKWSLTSKDIEEIVDERR